MHDAFGFARTAIGPNAATYYAALEDAGRAERNHDDAAIVTHYADAANRAYLVANDVFTSMNNWIAQQPDPLTPEDGEAVEHVSRIALNYSQFARAAYHKARSAFLNNGEGLANLESVVDRAGEASDRASDVYTSATDRVIAAIEEIADRMQNEP